MTKFLQFCDMESISLTLLFGRDRYSGECENNGVFKLTTLKCRNTKSFAFK